jgi:adenylate kinase
MAQLAPVIFILGPQGSGKGAQAELLAQRIGAVHLSSGQMFREMDDEKLKAELATANNVSSEYFYLVLEKGIKSVADNTTIILDGVGKQLHETEWLEAKLREWGRPVRRVIVLTLPREESMQRVMKRADIEGRSDDTPEGIQLRLNNYEAKTLPVVDFWRGKGLLDAVDGRGTIKEVAERINKVLNI